MSEVHDVRHTVDRAEIAAVAGDFVAADELLRSALRMQEAEKGPSHPDLTSTLTNLGIVAEKTGRPDDALAFYRRAAEIASAGLPPGDALVVESRKNLEEFCRERGLPVQPPALAAPAPRDNSKPAAPGNRPRWIAPAAIGAVVLLLTAVVLRRPVPTQETPAAKPAPENPAAADRLPQPAAAIDQPPPPRMASHDDNPNPPERKRPASGSAPGITLAAVELCRTLSTTGANWKCDPAGEAVSQTQLVLYTRVKSPRDTAVVHRWYRGQALRRSARLQVRANATEGYRTFSRLSVDGAGDWRVEIRSPDGDLLHERRFTVR